MGQGAQIAIDPLFGVVAHSAGVEHDHIGRKGIVGKVKSHLPQHAHQILAVGHVLLAAEGVHQGQRGMVQGLGQMGADLFLYFSLLRQIFRSNDDIFSIQKTFSCPAAAQRRVYAAKIYFN